MSDTFGGAIDLRDVQSDLDTPGHHLESLQIDLRKPWWRSARLHDFIWTVQCSCGERIMAHGNENLDVLLDIHRGRP